MSVKRQATTDLNHDNWDQDDPNEAEEAGDFKMATKEVLEKRVIRTAKRRSQVSKSSVFGGFSGFNKIEKSSFDFLANLTNGNQPNNGSSTPKTDAPAVSTSLVNTKPANSPSTMFNLSGTPAPISKSLFGQPTSESTPFGGIGSSPTFTQNIFATPKPNSSLNESLFKGQTSASSTPIVSFTSKSNASPDKPASTLFGIPSTTASNNNSVFSGLATTSGNNINSPFSSKPNNLTLFKTSVTSSTGQPSEVNKVSSKIDIDDKKLVYYNNLKGLNESVSAWIKKHVEETPLCILTPIFKDYEKHLKNIQDEYEKSKEQSSNENVADLKQDKETKSTAVLPVKNLGSIVPTASNSLFSATTTTASSSLLSTKTTACNSMFSTKNTSYDAGLSTNATSSPLITNTTSANSPFLSSISTTGTTDLAEKPTSTFTFGIKTSPTTVSANNISTAPISSPGFSFGIKPSSTTTSPFAVSLNNDANNSSTPFSFGIGKPFAFNSSITSNEQTNADDKEDEPPKVEYNPIAEENSIYEKKCKVFVKKDGNFVDKGVGTLYIKKIEEGSKYQLLTRANTSLGNVLINLILSSSIPTQRMGKNNVMMICMPTPDAKPPPTSILIRVKTSEDADELLETLNKYKA